MRTPQTATARTRTHRTATAQRPRRDQSTCTRGCSRRRSPRARRVGYALRPMAIPLPARRRFDVGRDCLAIDVADRGAGSRRPGAGPRLGQELTRLTRSWHARQLRLGGRGCAGRLRRTPSAPASTGFRSSSATSGTSTRERRETVQQVEECVPVERRAAAEASDEAAYRSGGDQLGGVEVGERRDAEGDGVHELGQHAAEAERHDRAEDGIAHDAGQQLGALAASAARAARRRCEPRPRVPRTRRADRARLRRSRSCGRRAPRS